MFFIYDKLKLFILILIASFTWMILFLDEKVQFAILWALLKLYNDYIISN